MSESLTALPSTEPQPGDLFVIRTRSGATYVLACGDRISAAGRIKPGDSYQLTGWFGTVALDPETGAKTDEPPRLEAPMRVFAMGRDEWQSTTALVSIQRLDGQVNRTRFDEIIETIQDEGATGESSDFDAFIEKAGYSPDDLRAEDAPGVADEEGS